MTLPLFIKSLDGRHGQPTQRAPRMRRFRLVLPTSTNAPLYLPILCTDDPFEGSCGIDHGSGFYGGGDDGGGSSVTEEECVEYLEQCLRFTAGNPYLTVICYGAYVSCILISD
jgi:hypothetical protein